MERSQLQDKGENMQTEQLLGLQTPVRTQPCCVRWHVCVHSKLAYSLHFGNKEKSKRKPRTQTWQFLLDPFLGVGGFSHDC